MRINGFEQIKGFYSWVFSNQDKQIKPQHISLYIFMVNQNNRNNWIEWFKLPFDLAMAGACISSKKTYYSCLHDLQEWALISYEKGINNWKAPLIKLAVLKDTSSVPQSEPQQHLKANLNSTTAVDSTVPQSEPQPIPNIKPLTSNHKPLTNNKESGEMLSPFETAFNDYLDMRKKIKKPPTERALELVRLKLVKIGKTDDDRILILEQSIRNGWQDVFPLKQDYQKEKGSAEKEKVSKFQQNTNSMNEANRILEQLHTQQR